MELESLSLVDLKNLAKEKGIPNYSKLKKSELIEAIMENYNNTKKAEEQIGVIEVDREDEIDEKTNPDEDRQVEGPAASRAFL